MRLAFFVKVVLILPLMFSLPLLAEEMADAEKEEAITILEDKPGREGTITVDFKDADIRNVLRVISYKGGVNIISAAEVKGRVSTRLVDVPWETALDVILKTYGFGYEKKENIIRVSTIEKLRLEKEAIRQLSEADKQQMAVINKVIELKYVDANDIKAAVEKQLSPQGSITVFQKTTRAGWQMMGLGGGAGAIARAGEAKKEEKSKTLIISDIPPVIEKITKLIEELDVLPKQIMIEALIVEINADDEEKLGINWDIEATLTGSKIPSTFPFDKKQGTRGKFFPSIDPSDRGEAQNFPAATDLNPTTPEEFFPYLPTGTTLSGVAGTASTAFTFGSLSFAAMQSVLDAIVTDVHYNLLSNPKIMTIDNQEARILVGEKYPIIKVETTDAGTLLESVERYEDIGIQLLVVPQIWEGNRINMIIHPAVSSVGATVQGDTITPNRITTREADTQVVVKSGETLVIGGLVKDQKTDTINKVPILGDIPLLGLLFRHKKTEIDKIELLIFVTPRIVEDDAVLTAYEKERLGKMLKRRSEEKWESRKKK
ncbi:MAG: type IV pilus secretin PilQ [Candidatus Omnitrophica bacterium]|nr:type IV pilus secretin PilQ [Candidatus Omnitrophota bacterium]